MDLNFSETQDIVRTTAREFMTRYYPKSLVRELEDEPIGFRDDIWKEVANLGWLGWVIPEEYGGVGGEFMDIIVLLEEMGRACFILPFFSTVICSLPIIAAGTKEQKEDILPRIAQGEMIFSLALTEPSNTYEPAGIETKAVAHGDEYVINGTKLFINDAQVAHSFLCAVRTETDDVNPENGITLFIVDAKSPGIKITPLDTIADDKQNEVVFENVKVSKDSIVGELNQGYPVIRRLLEQAAMLKCAEMMGGADWVVENTVAYAQERVQYGKPIGSYGIIQTYLAEMWAEVGIAKRLMYYAGWLVGQEHPCSKEVAMVKCFASEVYRKWTRMGVQIFGGIGTTREHDMGLYYRRARQGPLFFGDPDSMREKVAQEMGL